jgi:hypothetical protein
MSEALKRQLKELQLAKQELEAKRTALGYGLIQTLDPIPDNIGAAWIEVVPTSYCVDSAVKACFFNIFNDSCKEHCLVCGRTQSL